jgi:autotransporter passenger strand-loop-strand repeat protein
VVSSGGIQEILGGTAIATTVSSGGTEEVFYGTATSAKISGGGELEIGDGTQLSGTLTFAGQGGKLVIGDANGGVEGSMPTGVISGFALGDMIDLPGVAFSPGDTVAFSSGVLTVSAGGSQYLLSFGSVSGGSFHLSPDGINDAATGLGGTLVGYDQITSVASGVTSSGGSAGFATVQVVASGGTAVGTTVASGGEQDVFGTASRTVLGGLEVVYGKDSGATVNAGGDQYVYAGGTATNATVDNGGIQNVYGEAIGTSIGSGGYAFIGSGGSGVNFVISGGGTLEIADGGALGSGDTVTFAGSGGFLQVDDATMPGAVISGFAPGDSIGLSQVENVFPTLTLLSGNVLQVSLNFINYDFQFAPSQNFNGEQFEVTDYAPAGAVFAFYPLIYLVASSGTIVSSGTDFVSAAVTSTSVTVIDSGTLAVLAGGTALYTTLSSGGSEIVSGGGTDSGAAIGSGGTQADFGLASGASVSSGGWQSVSSGGTASGALILIGGTEYVYGGGTDLGAQVSGGAQYDYGLASGVTIFA